MKVYLKPNFVADDLILCTKNIRLFVFILLFIQTSPSAVHAKVIRCKQKPRPFINFILQTVSLKRKKKFKRKRDEKWDVASQNVSHLQSGRQLNLWTSSSTVPSVITRSHAKWRCKQNHILPFSSIIFNEKLSFLLSFVLRRDKSRNSAKIMCRVCLEDFQTTINFLSEPVDVYNDWVDACETAN